MSSQYTVDQWGWTQEISRRCKGARIGFRVDPSARTASTDGRTVIVPPLPEKPTRDDFMIHRGSVIHECGHILRPDAFSILKRENIKTGSPLWACMNIVEDAAQERALAGAWRGDRLTLSAMHGAIIRRQLVMMAKPRPPAEPDAVEQFKRLGAAMAVSLASASDWSREMLANYESYIRGMDKSAPGLAALAEELAGEGWPERIRTAGEPEGAWSVARELYARLFPEKPESENKQEPQEGKGDGEEDEEGDEGGKKPAKLKPGEGEDGEPIEGRIPWELLFHSDHAEEMGTCAPSGIDWTGKPVTRDGARYYDRHVVEKVPPGRGSTEAASVLKFPGDLAQQVRVLLQSMARKKTAHEKLEGRLDKRNLVRVLMPRVGDGTYNRSVFTQAVPRLTLDCCVTVLVDCSGSMSGEKFAAAALAAASLYDLANGSLRVPVELLGFSTVSEDYDHVPRYFEVKTYREPRAPRETIAARLLAIGAGRYPQGNADGDAILFAVGRMKRRTESRRILIVLSDGAPADAPRGDGHYADADVNLVAAIAAARATPGIEVYGVGIMDASVRRYYSPKAPVIRKPAEVPAALLEVLRDVLQRTAPT